MKAFVATSTDNGSFWVRQKLPLEELEKRGYEFTVATELEAGFDTSAYDVALFARAYTPEFTLVYSAFKRAGVPIVFDLDDAMDLVPDDNPVSSLARQWLPSVYFCLANSDAVTVTTERLKAHYRPMTYAPIHVLPNCVKASNYTMEEGPKDGPVRFGFAGSNTHLLDLVPAVRGFAAAQKRSPVPISLTLFGLSNKHASIEEMYEENRRIFKEAGKLEHPAMKAMGELYRATLEVNDLVWEKSVPIEEYHAKLSSLAFDFGLCPLIENGFNQYKSSIKAYEYAMTGAEVIASREPPFSDEVDFLGDGLIWNDQWEDVIINRATRPMGSTSYAKKQRDWVLANRDVEKEAARWDFLFKSLKRP